MFDNVMANVRNRMEDMHRNFVSLPPLPSSAPIGLDPLAGFECTTVRLVFQESMSTDSNAHSFHSSSVMTYSKVGNEPPKVFQASTSTRCAPGGVSCVSRGGQMLPELQEVFGLVLLCQKEPMGKSWQHFIKMYLITLRLSCKMLIAY